MLKALFDYLKTGHELTATQNFHYGQIPAGAPDNGTVIMERVPAGTNPYNTRVRWHRFQFLIRGSTYRAAETEANRLFEIIHTLRGITLDGWMLYDTQAAGPAFIGNDKKKRAEFSLNVTVSARKEA
jgi:hypothetical protein